MLVRDPSLPATLYNRDGATAELLKAFNNFQISTDEKANFLQLIEGALFEAKQDGIRQQQQYQQEQEHQEQLPQQQTWRQQQQQQGLKRGHGNDGVEGGKRLRVAAAINRPAEEGARVHEVTAGLLGGILDGGALMGGEESDGYDDIEFSRDLANYRKKWEELKKGGTTEGSRKRAFLFCKQLSKLAPKDLNTSAQSWRKKFVGLLRVYNDCIEKCHAKNETSFFTGDHTGRITTDKPVCTCVKN